MWLAFAFLSAALLGCYDVCKKHALRGNAVIPVLCINTCICCALFLPGIVGSALGVVGAESAYFIPGGTTAAHGFVVLKSCIVLSSWLCGYFAIKQLPLTIVGPINATRPVLTLLGAMLIYGERLNAWQWAGVLLAITSFYLLSRSGKREGISFARNRHILLLVAAALLGAMSGLYDKFLLAPEASGGAGLDRMFVQGWYNLYQAIMMTAVLLVLWLPARRRGEAQPFSWKWSIVLISLFLTVADLAYFYALSHPDALISVVSMVRRGSVLVSFCVGAWLFHEKNLRAKAFDLLHVLLSMVCLFIGGQ